MANRFRPDFGTNLEARAVEWLRGRYPTPKHYAKAAGLNPETAKKRLAGDDLDRRGLRLRELGRVVAGDWRDFIDQVWRPTFETPDEEIESKINELRAELEARRTARASGVGAAAPLDDEG